MEFQEEQKSTFKVVIIGNESVGKTSILTRLISNTFNPYEPGTLGPSNQVYEEQVEGETICMQLWDTAGQEKFKSLSPIYFQNASAAVIVFSFTNRESFDSLQQQIRQFIDIAGEDTVIFIAANKADLADDFEISIEEAKQWASDSKYRVFLTSAKSGEGIKQLFAELAADIYHKNQHKFQTVSPDLKNNTEEKKSCCK
ncbi:small GTP-binding protein [Histomonas meleagridis]|uniref:small GTP-binding protein n=1 Tax=Histomonas meleagridis TaxID=135588 RepID=UPI00355A33F2|nr:small GTP-binding protein [Histomonas meleagridis]KAH0806071.1 small GTP-binding protein [Histomonas meleagridis]